MTANKEGGGGATAGGRSRKAAPRSVAVCEQVSEMKLADGTPGQNTSVQTASKLLLAEGVII